MADDTTRRIFEVEVNAADALKHLAELKLRSQELRDQQKALGQVTKDNAEEYYALGEQVKATENEARKYQKEIQNNIKVETEQKNSLNQLKAQLALDTAAFSELGDSIENVDRKSELAKRIADTTEQLKQVENALGNSRRSVGDYQMAVVSLRKEMREATNKLQQLVLQGDTSSDTFKQLTARVQELKAAQAQATASTADFAKQTADSMRAVSSSFGLMVGTINLLQKTLSDFGMDSEQVTSIIKYLTVAITALNIATTLYNSAAKTNASYIAVQGVAVNMLNSFLKRHSATVSKDTANELAAIGVKAKYTAATGAQTGVLGAETTATTAATVATKLFSKALLSNPLMWFVGIVVALVAIVASAVVGITKLIKVLTGEAAAHRETAKAVEEYTEANERLTASLEHRQRVSDALVKSMEANSKANIEAMRQEGKTEEEIAAQELKDAKELNEYRTQIAQDNIKDETERYEALGKVVDAQEAELKFMREGSKRWRKLHEELEQNKKDYDEIGKRISDLESDVTNYTTDTLTKTREYNKKIEDDAKKTADNLAKIAAEANQKALDAALENSKTRQKRLESDAKYYATFIDGDEAAQLKHEADLLTIQQNGERERLKLQKDAGKLTEEEYLTQMALLEDDSRQAWANLGKSYNKYVSDTLAQAQKLIGGSEVEDKIAEIAREYADLEKNLKAIDVPVHMEGMSDEEFNELYDNYLKMVEDRDRLEVQLEEAKQKRIAEVEAEGRRTRLEAVRTSLQKEYDEELTMAGDNQRRQLELNNEMLQKEIEERRKMGETTYAQEAQILANEQKLRQMDLDNELIAADRNSKAVYEAKKAYLEAELAAHQDNADKVLEIEYELVELEREMWEERLDRVTDFADQAMDMLSGFNDFVSQLSDNQKDKITAEYEAETAAWEDKLNRGVITQEQYDAKMAELQAEQDQKTAELEREQAKRDKALSIMETVINTATSIMKTAATMGFPAAIPFIAVAAATGAAELATIIAEPLPTAGAGRYIEGPSHANGGVRIEAEGGEAIINKRSTSMFLPLLSAINEAGGGVPFKAAGSDGGYSVRSAMASGGVLSDVDLREAMGDALADMKVYVTVEDIQRETAKYVKVEQRGTY